MFPIQIHIKKILFKNLLNILREYVCDNNHNDNKLNNSCRTPPRSVCTSKEVCTSVCTSKEVCTSACTSKEVCTSVCTSKEVCTSVCTSNEVWNSHSGTY